MPAVALILAAALATQTSDASRALFESPRVRELRIVLDSKDAQRLREAPREYVPCELLEDGVRVSRRAALKLKGAAGSYQEFDERPALTVRMDRDGAKERYHGLARFHLNNAAQDPSLLREWLAAEICAEAGEPAARVTHARVWLGSRDMGVYVLKEALDLRFLGRHFSNPLGNLYEGGFLEDIDAPLERDEGRGKLTRADLSALAAVFDEPDLSARWNGIDELVDVRAYVRFTALELLLGHWDGYALNSNNYRVYFPPGGKARFVLHGTDQVLQAADAWAWEFPRSLVGASVMHNPPWRAAYRDELAALLELFEPQELAAKLDRAQARIAPALQACGADLARAQAESFAELRAIALERAEHVARQLEEGEGERESFELGVAARLDGWEEHSEVDDASFEYVDEESGVVRQIAAGESGRCVAGWRQTVVLPRGRYRFEALVETAGVRALDDEDPPGVGAGLRISGAARENSALGDGTRALRFQFEVHEQLAERVLVLELRAAAGRARWRDDAVTLTRVDELR